jgi:hypothetical protein
VSKPKKQQQLKVGDILISEEGRTATIKAISDETITVAVERLYRDKDDQLVVKMNERIVPRSLFATFALAYQRST